MKKFAEYYTENGALFGRNYFPDAELLSEGGKIKHKININPETVKRLEELYSLDFYDERMESVEPDKAIELHIGFERGKTDDDAKYVGKTIKATKKEMTLDYVLNKLNADSAYKNFSEYFNKLISKYGLGAYPTTYGIGVFVAVGFRKSIEETKSQVETALNELGIEYTTEYSDAGWVFRYKISKSAENISRIKTILENENKMKTGGKISEEKILEGNKLIATFMKKDIGHDKMVIWDVGVGEKNLMWTLMKYHSSWDWLMTAQKKISDLADQSVMFEAGFIIDDIEESLFNANIKSTWENIIEFIKWWNGSRS